MSSARWAVIPGLDGVYEVSDVGEIRRAKDGAGGHKKGLIRKQQVDAKGYARVVCRDPAGRAVLTSPHVAVLEAFVGPRPKGYDASHINGIRSDNRLENLVWETSSENHLRKIDHGTIIRGEKHKCSKLNESQVREIRARYVRGVTTSASIAGDYGVSDVLVQRIVAHKAWRHVV